MTCLHLHLFSRPSDPPTLLIKVFVCCLWHPMSRFHFISLYPDSTTRLHIVYADILIVTLQTTHNTVVSHDLYIYQISHSNSLLINIHVMQPNDISYSPNQLQSKILTFPRTSFNIINFSIFNKVAKTQVDIAEYKHLMVLGNIK